MMAVTNVWRSLKDAELVIQDATSPVPQVLRMRLDQGELRWTERQTVLELRDRGRLAWGHVRAGAEEPVELQFQAQWTQLLGKSIESSDPLQVYEMLTWASGLNLVSTSPVGQLPTLQVEFILFDPQGVASERIVFARTYRQELSLLGRIGGNRILFRGRDFETQPTVSRL